MLVIEQDLDLVARLRPELDVTWVEADACEVSTLDAAGLATVDVVVAATGDDEDNLVVSLLAKQEFAVPRVVARVNHPKNQWLFNETWGVDVSVSTPQLLTALVEEAVSVGTLVRLLQFEGGDAHLVEVTLADGLAGRGLTLADLGVPRDATVVAVVRDDQLSCPAATPSSTPATRSSSWSPPDAEDVARRLLVGALTSDAMRRSSTSTRRSSPRPPSPHSVTAVQGRSHQPATGGPGPGDPIHLPPARGQRAEARQGPRADTARSPRGGTTKSREIVREALEEIVEPIIFAEALDLIEAHRAAGHKVYLVSASPEEIVQPLAEHLGVDGSIASRPVLDDGGRYTGEMDFYAYGPFKADAMRELAARGDRSRGSSAYSDSYTDLPMLEAVGHPVAVNPDRVLAKVAKERDWEMMQFIKPVRLRDRMSVPSWSMTATAAGIAAAASAGALVAWRLARGPTVT